MDDVDLALHLDAMDNQVSVALCKSYIL